MAMKNTKTFDSYTEATTFSNDKQGEIRQKQNGKYQVSWGVKMVRSPAKYKTISFKSLPKAISFCNRIKKEGKETNTNQEIKVKTINDNLHNVRFIMTKTSDDYCDSWFDYNYVTDDF